MSNATYIPKRALSSEYCYGGLALVDGVCKYCNHANRVEIEKSVKNKTVNKKIFYK